MDAILRLQMLSTAGQSDVCANSVTSCVSVPSCLSEASCVSDGSDVPTTQGV